MALLECEESIGQVAGIADWCDFIGQFAPLQHEAELQQDFAPGAASSYAPGKIPRLRAKIKIQAWFRLRTF
jgi:hypothetical protein